MDSFAERYAAALESLMPDSMTVTNAQGMIVIESRGARVTISPPSTGDRRRPVSLAMAQQGLADAARKLYSEIPKYREQFKAPARILADYLRDASTPVGERRRPIEEA